MKKRTPRKQTAKSTSSRDALSPAARLVVEMLAVAGSSGKEGRIADLIARKLRQAGADPNALRTDQAHQRSHHGGEQGNLVLKLPGTRRGRRRLLMAHMDTVPLCEGCVPVVRSGYVMPADKETALGADDRAGCAVVLATALELLRGKHSYPPLTFLWTVQEEVGLCGARHLAMGLLGKPRLAFNFDGGSVEKLTVGATGGYRMDIRTDGIAAHAGNAPEAGVSAISIASLAIAELEREGWHGLVEKGGRRGTSNVGVIHGGQATNVVAPRAELRAEARSHDPQFRREIIAAMENAFRKAARDLPNCEGATGSVSFEGRLDYEAFLLPNDDPSVLAAEAAVRSIGGEPQPAITNGGLDANWMTARGVPTVSLGCGQSGQHTTAERLNLAEFERACRVALEMATARMP